MMMIIIIIVITTHTYNVRRDSRDTFTTTCTPTSCTSRRNFLAANRCDVSAENEYNGTEQKVRVSGNYLMLLPVTCHSLMSLQQNMSFCVFM